MNRVFVAIISVAVTAGCAPSNPPTTPAAASPQVNPTPDTNSAPLTGSNNEVVATIRGDDITAKDLLGPLIEANGLDVTIELAERALARQAASRDNITVSADDIANETKLTIERFRKAVHQTDMLASTLPTEGPAADIEAQRLLDQFLQYQHIGRSEFDIRMETNAYLRKIQAPKIEPLLTDKALHDRFNAVYGEKAHVRYILLSDVRAVAEVKRELQEGQKWEDEVRARSLDQHTREIGGDLPPFTRQDPRFTPEFKQVAFALAPGEVSDPITSGQYVVLVQKVANIPPTIVKFDDYKDSLRDGLREDLMQQAIGQLRENIGLAIINDMVVHDPVLKDQWAAKLSHKPAAVEDMTDAQKKWQKIREAAARAATQPTTNESATTEPATAPSEVPATPVNPTEPAVAPATAPAAAPDAATPATAPAR